MAEPYLAAEPDGAPTEAWVAISHSDLFAAKLIHRATNRVAMSRSPTLRPGATHWSRLGCAVSQETLQVR